MKPMKILHISTHDVRGGAARAAYRLHQGLREMGHDCRMAVRHKDTTDDSVVRIVPKTESETDGRGFFLEMVIQGQYIDSHRTDISNTLFSLPYPGYDLSRLSVVREADVINLHWVAQFQSPVTLRRLFSLGKPVVWTLHDQWPFTGGCHYAAGCERYKADCKGCPQLSDDSFDLAAAILRDKRDLFQGARLTLVSPSRWLGECARKSRLFGSFRTEVIPNSLETDIFTPQAKEDAKRSMGLPPQALTILFGAESGAEKRKGFQELVEALHYCQQDSWFSERIRQDDVRLISFGRGARALGEIGIPLISLEYLNSDDKVVEAYRAADIFIQPSIEDNLPNTMLEAMSCGTPVVGFDVGGMPDAVKDGVTGRLVPLGDVRAMGNAILTLLLNTEERMAMARNCRNVALESFSLHFQAGQYSRLYRELMEESGASGRPPTGESASNRADLLTFGREDPPGPTLDLSLGPNVRAIYDGVALKAMTELTPSLYVELKASNVDREARLAGLQQNEATIQWYERKLEEVQGELRASNADREARLAGLQQNEATIQWYERKLEEVQGELIASNADREARLKAIHLYQKELEDAQVGLRESLVEGEANLRTIQDCRERIQWLEERMRGQVREFEEQIQAREAAHREVVRSLEEKIADLSRAGRALKIFVNNILCPSFLKELFHRCYELFDQISPLESLRPRRLKGGGLKPYGAPMASVHSSKVQAFVTARSMEGDLDDRALELFYQMGKEVGHVLCAAPSPCNDQAVYMMAKRGTKVTYIADDRPIPEPLIRPGVTIVRDELGAWMAKTGERILAGYDAVVADLSDFRHDLLLLRGRLFENIRIFITGGRSASDPAVRSLARAGWKTHGVTIVDTPPLEWLDPSAKTDLSSGQTEWPWKECVFQLPPTLPSGRAWPKISVITVTLNQGDYLEETLRSVLGQGYPNLEYIVIDGASTDGTLGILHRYENRLSRCISEADKGQADALNKGFRLATGDILAWLNSDDLYLPDTLMRVALAFDAYETDMVSGGCSLVLGKSKTPFRVHHSALPFGKPVPLPLDRLLNVDGYWQQGDFFYQPEVFWSRGIWLKSGASVDEGLFYSMDYDLWVRMARVGATIVHVPDALSLFRMHDGQKTSGEDLPFLGELRRVSEEFMRGLR